MQISKTPDSFLFSEIFSLWYDSDCQGELRISDGGRQHEHSRKILASEAPFQVPRSWRMQSCYLNSSALSHYRGAALLVEAANMGDPDAQYDLGCHLRVQNENVQSDQQALYYIEKAVDQLHPQALYLLGSVFLAGDCVQQDVGAAMWCFYRASSKGHAGAAIACGSLLLRGEEIPETIRRMEPRFRGRRRGAEVPRMDVAREQFTRAADAGCDLGLQWIRRLDQPDCNLL
ncbi:binding protein isoform X3 [Wolffia australiana]